MSNEMNHTESNPTSQINRRGLFRIGGLTVAGAVVVAACGKTEAGELGSVGEGATTPVLPDPIVDNGVLLRTMAGLELSIVNAYERMLEEGLLAGSSAAYPTLGDLTELVTEFAAHHVLAAKSFNRMATQHGAEAWNCGNTRLDSAYIFPVFDRVLLGVEATDAAPKIEPSDDPLRDMANLIHTLESLSSESCQALMPQVTEADVRATAMQLGVRSARHAAAIALRINPGGYVSATDAVNAQPVVVADATTTTVQDIAAGGGTPAVSDAPKATDVPLPVAVPTQYGSLSPITYIGGRGDENGVRLKLNFESPSLNSLAYPFDVCAAG
ncbi:MAG: hypothetical protein Q7V57_15150 [Actinomycetota bacterium]|nr:hypothetical protein [Actinomycetota bacterium]